MDKETLSNYGWIVICVIVLAVMIALAPDFAEAVKNAVVDATKQLIGHASTALDGISTASNPFN
jgi:hypothetical protein